MRDGSLPQPYQPTPQTLRRSAAQGDPAPKAMGARCRRFLPFRHEVLAVKLHQQGMGAELLHPSGGAFVTIGITVPERGADVGIRRLLRLGRWAEHVAGQLRGAVTSSLNGVPLASSRRKQENSRRGRSNGSRGCSLCRKATGKAGERAGFEVGAFYWTVLVPDIVNPGREEQGSVSV